MTKRKVGLTMLGAVAATAAVLLVPGVGALAEDEAPTPPPFDQGPFSEEPSHVPTEAEWKKAAAVTLDPASKLPPGCAGSRVREWVRLHCRGPIYGAVRMLGGKRDGLQVRFHTHMDEFSGAVDVAFPVRRGDQRVIEVMELEIGYKGMMSVLPRFVVSEHWFPEDERPTLVIR